MSKANASTVSHQFEADAFELRQRLEDDIRAAGPEQESDPNRIGAIGATMFDLPGSEDNTLTVLLSQDQVQGAPSQALVRIKSRQDGDGRQYLGIVTAGPFAEPDSLRADSHMLVTVATRGGLYLPPFHGRVQVSILGEELKDGTLVPPRLRPLPNSPVFHLTDEESAKVLRSDGDIRLGLVVGHKSVVVGIPSDKKLVLPRHLAVLGTTGGGKSTTVARLVQQAQAAGMAVILLDVEGEYTHLHEPTDNKPMLEALQDRDLQPVGIPANRMKVYHLVGRESANPKHPGLVPFSLQFARISPYAAAEILGLSEAQEERFRKAYDVGKAVMRDLGIFPAKGNADQERDAMEIDEFERGYPRMTLSFLIDIAGACLAKAESGSESKEKSRKKDDAAESCASFSFRSPALQTPAAQGAVRTHLYSMRVPGNTISWLALLGKLWRLQRLNVFYDETSGVKPLIYSKMLQPGQVSVVDLSDSGSSELNNIVIADLLRGIQSAQDDAYQAFEKNKATDPNAPPPTRVLIVIEEAHEFLSAERIDKMRILFEQVARIAKRGRKRWLGLAFVTQLPQHLPRQVFGLVNSYILHKITDPQVVSTLERTVSGIDAGLWKRLSGLAPGQAIVSFPHMTRPLLVAVDPTPAKLRLVD
ncbi:MAG: ATP-binding protein [Gemmataceae bacterium]|nr:ATP-binding protein [Gemmataceae bacterium]